METPYVEIIFTGEIGEVKKLLTNLNAELGDNFGPFFISEETGITDEGRIRKVLEAIKLVEDHSYALVPAKDLEAVSKQVAESGIKIHSVHKVVEKRLSFKFECFNEEVSSKIKTAFEGLPPGVTLEGYKPETLRDASAKGQELYTSAHDYEFRGQGVAKGPVKGLVEFRKAISELDHVEVDDITLVLSDEITV